MKPAIALIGLLTLGPGLAQAASPLTFYTTRAALTVAYPGMSLQTFTSADLYDEPFVTHANPLDRKTNDPSSRRAASCRALRSARSSPGSHPMPSSFMAAAPLERPASAITGSAIRSNCPSRSACRQWARMCSATRLTARASRARSTRSFFTARLPWRQDLHRDRRLLSFHRRILQHAPIADVRITWQSDGDANTYVSDIAFK